MQKEHPNRLSNVGMVIIAAVDDRSWGSEGYRGLKCIYELGFGEVNYVERVIPSEWENAFEKFALQGYNLVLGHGGELSEAVLHVAERHPEVMFACINGHFTGHNLASFEIKDEQGSYLAGVLAAKLSKTHRVGFVGGQKIPATIRHASAYIAGARACGASAEVAFCINFSDPHQAEELTLGLIQNGSDLFYYYLNEGYRGLLQACNQFHCQVICSVVDRPDEVLGGSVACVHENVGELHVMATRLFAEGDLRGIRYRIGLEDPDVEKLVLHTVDPRISQDINELQDRIISRSVFIPKNITMLKNKSKMIFPLECYSVDQSHHSITATMDQRFYIETDKHIKRMSRR